MTKTSKAATVTATAKVEAPANHHDFYKTKYLNKWLTDVCGPVPALGLFDVAHAINAKRPGAELLHIAMCLRPKGCTVREFQVAGDCGPANNYRRHLVTGAKVIKVEVLPRDGEGRAYAYKATLTAKALKVLADAGVKVPAALAPVTGDKPVKAPRRAKPVKAPVVEVVEGDQPQA